MAVCYESRKEKLGRSGWDPEEFAVVNGSHREQNTWEVGKNLGEGKIRRRRFPVVVPPVHKTHLFGVKYAQFTSINPERESNRDSWTLAGGAFEGGWLRLAPIQSR